MPISLQCRFFVNMYVQENCSSVAHFTVQALLSSLSTPTAQHCVPTRTESYAGRIVLTQQTRLPRHSTGLDCSESGFTYQTFIYVYVYR